MTEAPPEPALAQQATFRCAPDTGFAQWIAAAGGTLAVSTYQAGKLLLIGWNGQQLSLLPRHFDKPMGLDARDGQLLLSSRNGLMLLANDTVLAHHYQHDHPGRYDALYLPRASYHTGDLNTHDVALGKDGPWMLATRFSCIARPSARWSFEPWWRPPFVSELVPEDRCHLNGLALVDDEPRYVTCLGVSDIAGGWRQDKAGGGILMDVRSGEILLRGLAMPHSPRWHAGQLWVLDSGQGRLLRVNPSNGESDVVCELPGYLRGLCFAGDYALIGLCRIRESAVFGDMPVQARHPELQCGVSLVDLRSGREAGRFSISEGCSEIYDLRFLPGQRRVNVLNLEHAQTTQAFNAPPDLHYWLRPENEIRKSR